MAEGLGKDVVSRLQATPLFAGLAEADVRALAAGASVVSLADQHPLYDSGAPLENLYVVLDGHVELSIEIDGRRVVVEVARRGAVLGDAALFAGRQTLMAARVLSGATLLAIPAEPFAARLEERFDVLLHVLSVMSLRLRTLVRQIAELKLKTTAQRLGSFLLSFSDAASGRAEIRFPYDKKLVAEELGMKPESLSRALAKLGRLGIESLPDNVVMIADIGRLRQFCVEDDLG